MKRIIAAVIAVLSIAGLAACGSGPSYAACKAAMKAQYEQALTSGKQGTEPAACKGLSTAQLTKIFDQVMTEQ